METVNPFTDPDFKKQILSKEGRTGSDDSYEVLEPEIDSGTSNLKSLINSAPKIPKQVKNVIMDASALTKSDKEAKAAELNIALNDIFTKYNKEYSTDLQIDFSSFSRTLVNVADPESRHVLELYLSEIFQSVRPMLILHMISKLSLAIDYILSPERMFGGDMTLQDTWICVEKILQFVQQLETMRDDIVIKGSDLELRQIAAAKDGSSIGDMHSNPVVQDFMNLFKKDNGIEE